MPIGSNNKEVAACADCGTDFKELQVAHVSWIDPLHWVCTSCDAKRRVQRQFEDDREEARIKETAYQSKPARVGRPFGVWQ